MNMKNIYLSFILFLFSGLILNAQTDGELSVSVATGETGGNYAPRNIVAIWVEDDGGNFVKTLLAYAQTRKTHLNTWQASTAAAGSEYNTIDAITGATRSSHATRVCNWDGTDFNGNLLADGIYHVWMELTDKNATGNFSSFSFTKSNIAEILSPVNVPSFGSISISWEPSDPTNISEIGNKEILIYPNPGSGIFTISGNAPREMEVKNISGKLILKTTNQTIDISDQPNGVYFLVVKSKNYKKIFRLIKN